jgi:hypothetical protein
MKMNLLIALAVFASASASASASAVFAVAATSPPSARVRAHAYVCNQKQWCTLTAAGDVTAGASQLAIGNVKAGTVLAVSVSAHQQYGGEFIGGDPAGFCGWSQYARDYTPAPTLKANSDCANPVTETTAFVADDGHAIWSGCYPRCFGGVPLRLDPRCGARGHTWCYLRNCEEYANFYPWLKLSHPTDAIRMTSGQQLDIRYRARYVDARLHSSFYMVRDTTAAHGSGNWVFIGGAACGISAGATGAYHWLQHPHSR